LPVVVDNDVNALVAAEQWFGSGREAADFLVVSLGRGAGLVVHIDDDVITCFGQRNQIVDRYRPAFGRRYLGGHGSTPTMSAFLEDTFFSDGI